MPRPTAYKGRRFIWLLVLGAHSLSSGRLQYCDQLRGSPPPCEAASRKAGSAFVFCVLTRSLGSTLAALSNPIMSPRPHVRPSFMNTNSLTNVVKLWGPSLYHLGLWGLKELFALVTPLRTRRDLDLAQSLASLPRVGSLGSVLPRLASPSMALAGSGWDGESLCPWHCVLNPLWLTWCPDLG